MKVYAKYLGEGNFVPGVPARDLSRDEWDALTDEQRAACRGLYSTQRTQTKTKAKDGE